MATRCFLAPGQLVYLFVSWNPGKAHSIQDNINFGFLPDLSPLSSALSLEAKGNIPGHIHHGKKGQVLENKVHRPFIGGDAAACCCPRMAMITLTVGSVKPAIMRLKGLSCRSPMDPVWKKTVPAPPQRTQIIHGGEAFKFLCNVLYRKVSVHSYPKPVPVPAGPNRMVKETGSSK